MKKKLILCVVIFLSGMQFLSAQNVTLNYRDVRLETVMNAITQQTGYAFIYSQPPVDINKTVSINVTDTALGNALENLLGSLYNFQIKEQRIYLSQKQPSAPTQQQPATRNISGNITDASGEPVIGATVVVKGDATKGTVTDYDGNFALQSVPQNATISISYVGYQTVELPANSAQLANLVLSEDSELLDEVVVVGYGVQRRVNLTGAVSTISGSDLNERPVVSAATALQGADPSVNIGFNTGSPASGYSINIRGVMSVNGGNPLILVDGVETSLTQVNPNDIESVSVLKDASASAIYGAKASSGVILITTKKGADTQGDAKISYGGRYGISQNTTSDDYITTGYDHVNLVNNFYRVYQGRDMLLYSGDELKLLEDRRNDTTEHPDRPWTIIGDDNRYYYYGNFDWHNYFYRKTRPQHEHNVSLTGGTEKVNYYISGRYLEQDGIFKIYPDKYNNYSFRGKLDAQLKQWLRYSLNTNFNNNDYKYAGFRNEQQTIHSLQSNISSAFLPHNP
ncbi:MAG: SusC/RagA family TonB-linked outer membrane protein, partial [Bacteroidia bacterium]|nr:SusC/RagA family TonB-linked outer membrane protein [Bacteroidia bacterium]